MTYEDQLLKLGYEVQRFNEWHHRVDGVFDFWTGSTGCKWHDRVTNERGSKPPDQIVFFIQQKLGRPGAAKVGVTKAEFIRRLVSIGWTYEEGEKEWYDKKSRHTS